MKVRYLCPPPSQVADIQEELEVAKEQLELSRDKEREMRRRSRPTPAAEGAACGLQGRALTVRCVRLLWSQAGYDGVSRRDPRRSCEPVRPGASGAAEGLYGEPRAAARRARSDADAFARARRGSEPVAACSHAAISPVLPCLKCTRPVARSLIHRGKREASRLRRQVRLSDDKRQGPAELAGHVAAGLFAALAADPHGRCRRAVPHGKRRRAARLPRVLDRGDALPRPRGPAVPRRASLPVCPAAGGPALSPAAACASVRTR